MKKHSAVNETSVTSVSNVSEISETELLLDWHGDHISYNEMLMDYGRWFAGEDSDFMFFSYRTLLSRGKLWLMSLSRVVRDRFSSAKFMLSVCVLCFMVWVQVSGCVCCVQGASSVGPGFGKLLSFRRRTSLICPDPSIYSFLSEESSRWIFDGPYSSETHVWTLRDILRKPLTTFRTVGPCDTHFGSPARLGPIIQDHHSTRIDRSRTLPELERSSDQSYRGRSRCDWSHLSKSKLIETDRVLHYMSAECVDSFTKMEVVLTSFEIIPAKYPRRKRLTLCERSDDHEYNPKCYDDTRGSQDQECHCERVDTTTGNWSWICFSGMDWTN